MKYSERLKETHSKPKSSCAKSSKLNNLKKENSISTSVVFGMPAKDCSYNGICRIEPLDMFNENTSRCIGIATITRVGTKHLLFQFPKDQMHRLTIHKHFGSGYFVLLEDYETPEFVGKVLGQCAPVIRQGIYPIVDKDDFFEVIF